MQKIVLILVYYKDSMDTEVFTKCIPPRGTVSASDYRFIVFSVAKTPKLKISLFLSCMEFAICVILQKI